MNQMDAFGNTPLHLAALHNKMKLIRLLLEFGADKLKENTDGNNALDLATLENHKSVQMMLAK